MVDNEIFKKNVMVFCEMILTLIFLAAAIASFVLIGLLTLETGMVIFALISLLLVVAFSYGSE